MALVLLLVLLVLLVLLMRLAQLMTTVGPGKHARYASRGVRVGSNRMPDQASY